MTMETLYEYYTEGANFQSTIPKGGLAQTFTPKVRHKITHVKLQLSRVGTPGKLVISIQGTKKKLPDNVDLAVAVVDGNTIKPMQGTRYTHVNLEDWYWIEIPDGPILEADTGYAIVAKSPYKREDNYINWVNRDGNPQYPGGGLCYYDGKSWHGMYGLQDLMFEEWGEDVAPLPEDQVLPPAPEEEEEHPPPPPSEEEKQQQTAINIGVAVAAAIIVVVVAILVLRRGK